MTNGQYLIGSVISGMIGGGIGAAVSQNSDHPIIHGALVVGLISGITNGLFLAGLSAQTKQIPASSGTVSGLQREWGL